MTKNTDKPRLEEPFGDEAPRNIILQILHRLHPTPDQVNLFKVAWQEERAGQGRGIYKPGLKTQAGLRAAFSRKKTVLSYLTDLSSAFQQGQDDTLRALGVVRKGAYVNNPYQGAIDYLNRVPKKFNGMKQIVEAERNLLLHNHDYDHHEHQAAIPVPQNMTPVNPVNPAELLKSMIDAHTSLYSVSMKLGYRGLAKTHLKHIEKMREELRELNSNALSKEEKTND